MTQPAKALYAKKVEGSLRRNIMPLVHEKFTVLVCRATCLDPDTSQVKKNIVKIRKDLDEKVLKFNGVQFLISSITGTSTNDKRVRNVRPGIAYFICYTNSGETNEEMIFKCFHDCGFNAITSHIKAKSSNEAREKIMQCLKQAVKDYNSSYAVDMVKKSIQNFPLEQYPVEPCRIICKNDGLYASVRNAVANLRRDGMPLSFERSDNRNSVSFPMQVNTNIGKAIEAVKCVMAKMDHGLRLGNVYQKVKKSTYTYHYFCTAEEYIHKLLGVAAIQDDIINQTSRLSDIFGKHACTVMPQLRFDPDLIEVNGGKCFKLSTRKFIKTPLKVTDIGKVSPRCYQDYTFGESPKDGGFFRTSVENSFPELAQRINFLNKFYQCLLYDQLPLKVKKLVVCGKKDSGKTSWAQIFFGLFGPSKIVSVTKEKTFGTSMITEETELTIIDEWSKDTMDADKVKQVFQGGRFPQAIKNQTGRSTKNKGAMLITCNEEPYFDEEQPNIDRRIDVFHTKPLPSPNCDAPQWMFDNAMECVVWMAAQINDNVHLVKAGELFYQLPGHEQAKCSMSAARVCTETERMVGLRADEIYSVNVSAMESDDENNESQADQPSWLSRCRKEDCTILSVDVPSREESSDEEVTAGRRFTNSDINTKRNTGNTGNKRKRCLADKPTNELPRSQEFKIVCTPLLLKNFSTVNIINPNHADVHTEYSFHPHTPTPPRITNDVNFVTNTQTPGSLYMNVLSRGCLTPKIPDTPFMTSTPETLFSSVHSSRGSISTFVMSPFDHGILSDRSYDGGEAEIYPEGFNPPTPVVFGSKYNPVEIRSDSDVSPTNENIQTPVDINKKKRLPRLCITDPRNATEILFALPLPHSVPRGHLLRMKSPPVPKRYSMDDLNTMFVRESNCGEGRLTVTNLY